MSNKSEPKLCFNERNVCLPFPQPLLKSDGHPIWPFSQKGFPLFYGTINFNEKCVEISDEMGVKALQMGFFGFHSKFKFFENKVTKESNNCSNSKTQIKSNSKYLNGKYVLTSTSIPNALTFTEVSNPEENKDSTQPMSNDLMTEKESKKEKVLKLSFLESFFISYVFGSLNVLNTETNNYMTIEEMWDTFNSRFSEDKLEFAVHYSAYHYFRSKGWVVRNGHSFGSHFLLYKESPQLYHSLYSVLIQYSIDGQNKQPFDWYYMSALIRLSKNVRKELIVCVVNLSKDYDISSPKCIQNFEIGLLRFDRWNVTKTGFDTKQKH